jgi:hypothetical protein
MVAPEVVVARVTTTALFCAAVVEIVGTAACVVPLPVPVFVVPPPPQPVRKTMLAHSTNRKPDFIKSAIRSLLLLDTSRSVPAWMCGDRTGDRNIH